MSNSMVMLAALVFVANMGHVIETAWDSESETWLASSLIWIDTLQKQTVHDHIDVITT